MLLVHGFTGTPSELRPMGSYLQEKGYTVYAPLLAGHGTSPEEMNETTWNDWWQSTLDGYEKLKEKNVRYLFAVGLSMGGMLVLNLARKEKLDGVIPLNAPIWIQDKRAPFVNLVRLVKSYQVRKGTKPPHIEDHLVPYDRTPLKCVSSLRQLVRHVRSHLNQVDVPALVVQAKKDETVEPRSAEHILEQISSADKTLLWYPESSHIISLDRERKKLFTDIDAFIQRVVEGKRVGKE